MKQALIIFFALVSCGNLNAQTFKVDTTLWSGPTENRVNLVILGDGYTMAELPEFDLAAADLADYVLAQRPMDSYRNFFNVFSIRVPSNESGAALDPSALIDNYFGSTYNYAGIDRLLVPTRRSAAFNVLINNFPEYDQVMVVVNHEKYGGSGGTFATTSIHNSAPEIAAHEIGHSFSNLRDEYWAGPQYARESLNMTQKTDVDSIIWANWYGEFEVGLYSFSEDPSWHRPHENCKMRRLGPEFCAVCTEAFIERIHRLVDALDGYSPSDLEQDVTHEDSLQFTLQLIKPEPNTLSIKWLFNDEIIEEDTTQLLIMNHDLDFGEHKLEAMVFDSTDLSRWDDVSNRLSWVEWSINKDVSTSINSRHLEVNFKTWPNPFTSSFNITVDQAVIARLWDMEGRLLQEIEVAPGTQLVHVDQEGGDYILELEYEGKKVSTRLRSMK